MARLRHELNFSARSAEAVADIVIQSWTPKPVAGCRIVPVRDVQAEQHGEAGAELLEAIIGNPWRGESWHGASYDRHGIHVAGKAVADDGHLGDYIQAARE